MSRTGKVPKKLGRGTEAVILRKQATIFFNITGKQQKRELCKLRKSNAESYFLLEEHEN